MRLTGHALACLALAGACGSTAGGAGDGGDTTADPLAAAVAQPDRPEADRARDRDRRPAEVLRFCGIEPGMRVLDLMAGTGYYTEILALALGPDGLVVSHNSPFVLDRYARRPWTARLARLEPLGNVRPLEAAPEEIEVSEPMDAALLIRFYHDFYWQKVDRAAFNARVFAALRPGGVFCVLDHHAEPGSGARDAERLHRIDARLVRAEIERAGFVFEASSELLRRSDDDRTWNIFADGAARRDRTDRFLFRFRKPRR
ncbi:MAG: SAM-dependent methyltransferase [Acidobacteria bacterium]|nr:MAG: SAM-dependent methyltransferase [Acidobacteriota bacterium]